MTSSNSKFLTLTKKEDLAVEARRLRQEGLTIKQIAKRIQHHERHVYRLLAKAKDFPSQNIERLEHWDLSKSIGDAPEKTEFLLDLGHITNGESEWAWQISSIARRNDFTSEVVTTFATLLEDSENDWQISLISHLLRDPPWLGDFKTVWIEYFMYATRLIDADIEWQKQYVCYVLYKVVQAATRKSSGEGNSPYSPEIFDELVDMFFAVYEDKERIVFGKETFS
jgi:hypothetical protein